SPLFSMQPVVVLLPPLAPDLSLDMLSPDIEPLWLLPLLPDDVPPLAPACPLLLPAAPVSCATAIIAKANTTAMHNRTFFIGLSFSKLLLHKVAHESDRLSLRKTAACPTAAEELRFLSCPYPCLCAYRRLLPTCCTY